MSKGDSNIPQTLHAEMYCATCDRSYSAHEQTCPIDGTALVGVHMAEPASMTGRVLNGRYRLLDQLGSGGMGVVYRATQLDLDREVAIKLIRSEFAQKPDTAKRFLRESRICGKLSNPHIVNVQEMGRSEEGELFLAMELLRGRSLDEVLKSSQALPVERAAWIVSQVCEALVAAHAMDVVHRDLKPHNIMILDNPPGRDFVKVLDFGLAKSLAADSSVTQSGSLVGTPLYMPPEMLLDGKVDARSDQYSLGVIFYQLVAGVLPFQAETIPGLLLKQAHAAPDPLPESIPAAVRDVILRLLSKQPSERYESAAAARAAIVAAVGLSEEGFDSFPVARAHVQARSRATTVDSEEVVASTQAALPTGKQLPRARLWMGGVVALVAGLALLLIVGKGSEPRPEPGAAAPPKEVPRAEATTKALPDVADPVLAVAPADAGVAVASETPEVVEAVSTVELRFTSSPSATLVVAGQEIGSTPQTLEVEASDVGLEVSLRRKGYEPISLQVIPSKSQAFAETLKRIRKHHTSSGAHDSSLPF